MKYELIRLFRNRYVQILSMILIIVSLLLFHNDLNDSTYEYSYRQIGMKYSMNTDIEAELEELDTMIANQIYSSNDCITGFTSLEKILDLHILERNSESEGYQEWREQFLKDNDIKINSGLFGDENRFEIKALNNANAVYEELDTVQTETGFWGSEAVFRYRLSDLFIIFAAILISLKTVLDDRTGNMELLQMSTVNGSQLVYKKLGAVMIAELLFTTALYGGEWVVACCILPVGSFNAAIQSVYGFREVPFALSVAGFASLFILVKLLWIMTVTIISFTVVHLSSSLAVSAAAMSVLTLFQLVLRGSHYLWLRSLSLIQLADSADLLSGLMYLNLFGLPVPRLCFIIVWLLVLILVCLLLLKITRQPVYNSKKNNLKNYRQYPVSLWGIEGRKLLIHSGGLVFAGALIAVQIYRAVDIRISLTAEEYAFRNYSLVLQGIKDDWKDEYIREQRDTFAGWHERLDQLMAAPSLSEEALNTLSSEIQRYLNNEAAFERAAQKYERLAKDEYYVYQTGFEQLFGIPGRKQDYLSSAVLMLVIAFVISINETRENECRMSLQISVSPKSKIIRAVKTIQYSLYAAVLVLPAFLPYLFKINNSFGLYGIQYPAESLHMFPSWVNGYSVLTILLFTFAVRMILAAIATVIYSFLIHKSSDLSVSFGTGLVLLVMPLLVLYLKY